jgi:protein-disulfide isomerase
MDEYAKSLKLDMEKLKEDLKSEKVSKKINFDQQMGRKENVNATPTMFLNGKKLNEEAGDMTKLSEALTQAVKEAR